MNFGRYLVDGELGKGGMGIVYRGLDPLIGRPVAIKTIRVTDSGTAAETANLRERLLRESRAAGVLSHANIVAIYDVGQEGDTAYIVMEFIAGPTLERLQADDPDFRKSSEIIRILADCARGLDYAHSRGIVHRDIKPANIMVQHDGTAKIADFGIAKISQASALTQTSAVMGSPHYMSPEQLKGKPVSGQSDQYALAIMAYSLLAGRPPFEADTIATLVAKALYEEPTTVQVWNPALPAGVDVVLKRALAKEPTHRYSSCTEFVDALRSSMDGRAPVTLGAIPIAYPAPPTPAPPTPYPPQAYVSPPQAYPSPPTYGPATPMPLPMMHPPAKKSRLRWVFAILLLLAGCFAGLYYVGSQALEREAANRKPAVITTDPPEPGKNTTPIYDPPAKPPNDPPAANPEKTEPEPNSNRPSDGTHQPVTPITPPVTPPVANKDSPCAAELAFSSIEKWQLCADHWSARGASPATVAAYNAGGTIGLIAAFQSGGPTHLVSTMIGRQDRQNDFDSFRAKGYRPEQVSVLMTSEGPKFTTVWAPLSGHFRVKGRIRGMELQREMQENRANGLRLVDLVGFNDGGVFYSAAWIQETGVDGVVFPEVSEQDLPQHMKSQTARGQVLQRFSQYETPAGRRWVEVWEQSARPFYAFTRLTRAQFAQNTKSFGAQGYHLHQVSVLGDEFTAIWSK